ncbi:MAG: thiopeptide-type bacteriocin biosynthesis protein [Thiohalospira sp.]
MKRNFIIGDEWLYYKIYCGPKTADEILIQIVKPLTEKLFLDRVIDKWFFIRYADPKKHLRVRFHYNQTENILVIINTINKLIKPYVEQNLVNNILIETYKRELERYGNDSIELAEELFFYNSQMIIDFISLIEGYEGEIIRWLFALRAIDQLLEDFGFTDFKKLELLYVLKEGFGNEFGMNKSLKLQLDKKFRDNREKINNIFKNRYESEDIGVIINLLKRKSNESKNVIQEILKREKETRLEKPLNDLLGSYIHMLMNKLFKSKQRIHEMVIYDFLYRYYKSEIAKKEYYY